MSAFGWIVDTGQRLMNVFSYFIAWLDSPINDMPDTGTPLVDALADASMGLIGLLPDFFTRGDLLFNPTVFYVLLGVAVVSFFTNIVT